MPHDQWTLLMAWLLVMWVGDIILVFILGVVMRKKYVSDIKICHQYHDLLESDVDDRYVAYHMFCWRHYRWSMNLAWNTHIGHQHNYTPIFDVGAFDGGDVSCHQHLGWYPIFDQKTYALLS